MLDYERLDDNPVTRSFRKGTPTLKIRVLVHRLKPEGEASSRRDHCHPVNIPGDPCEGGIPCWVYTNLRAEGYTDQQIEEALA
jgi:hypothetical protein